MTLTDTDAGREIHVRASVDFMIRLSTASGTGFRWLLAQPPDDAVCKMIDHRAAAASRSPGGPLVETWTFHANAAGQARLRFSLKRAWAADTAQEIEFPVVVEG